ncbi:hypothetical protein K439DRAFT_941470 [Ramaria rubella]|nr:hypothetical protein K439DRAFT_941470 [Ramaria rubella]
MNIQQLYCLIQGIAALYFIAVIIPSISIEVYKPRPSASPTSYSSTPPAPVPAPTATAAISSLVELDDVPSVVEQILKPVTVAGSSNTTLIVIPSTAIISLPYSPNITPLSSSKPTQTASNSLAPIEEISHLHDFITLPNSICLLAFAIVIGTLGSAGTRRFAKAASQQRRPKERGASRRPKAISDSHATPKTIRPRGLEDAPISQRDIFAVYTPPKEYEVLNQFAVPSAFTAIPARMPTGTGDR